MFSSNINALHLHMYLVGKITLATLLVLYPAENSTSVAAKAATATQNKGEIVTLYKP